MQHLEAGAGPPLVHLKPPGGLRLTRADELLARSFRVVVLEAATSGEPSALVARMMEAIGALGIDRFDLMGTSVASMTALAVARAARDRVGALVLEAPMPMGGGRVADLTTPALVVFGAADPVAVPETSGHFKERLPNAHLVFVYAAGHAVADDRPEAFAEVVADFLERREGFVVSRATTVIHP